MCGKHPVIYHFHLTISLRYHCITCMLLYNSQITLPHISLYHSQTTLNIQYKTRCLEHSRHINARVFCSPHLILASRHTAHSPLLRQLRDTLMAAQQAQLIINEAHTEAHIEAHRNTPKRTHSTATRYSGIFTPPTHFCMCQPQLRALPPKVTARGHQQMSRPTRNATACATNASRGDTDEERDTPRTETADRDRAARQSGETACRDRALRRRASPTARWLKHNRRNHSQQRRAQPTA